MKRITIPVSVFVMLAVTVITLALTVGCTYNSAPDRSDLKQDNLVYFKDSRTGVCYAAMNSLDTHSYAHTTTITYVPCTPEVEKLIK